MIGDEEFDVKNMKIFTVVKNLRLIDINSAFCFPFFPKGKWLAAGETMGSHNRINIR
jgi:hypothetical protein